MEGELIRINHNEEKKQYSIVHWETGEPKHDGPYLVTYRNTETLLNVCTCLYRMGSIWVNGYIKEIDSDLIVAWCRLKDIKPCREVSIMEENKVHIPFKLKDGECYSIIRPDDSVVGIFISKGIVYNYPNGDSKGNIEYRVHACLFETGHILNPVILSGPDINGYGGVQYPRECGVRYSTDKEKNLLLKKLRMKKFKWDTENRCIVKQDKKGNNG